MSNENEAFEKWFNKLYGNEPIALDELLDYQEFKSHFSRGWQAAKADSAQEIADLKEQLTIAYMAGGLDRNSKITELQAHINVLREALEGTVSSLEGYRKNINDLQPCDAERIAKQILAQTPAQSLQAIENEVIDRVGMLVNDWTGDADLLAKIEALKGQQC